MGNVELKPSEKENAAQIKQRKISRLKVKAKEKAEREMKRRESNPRAIE